MDQNAKPKHPDTFDELRGVGIASGLPPSDVAYGPLRPPPVFYVGEHIGAKRVNKRDVERHQNGAVPGTRNKFMRRVLRKKLKERGVAVVQGLKLGRAMRQQTREIAVDEGKSAKWADRLLEQELDIHRPVHVPTKAELRQMRTERRAAARKGELLGDPVNDTIAKLVDAQAAKKAKP